MRAILEDAVASRPGLVTGWLTPTEPLRGQFGLPERAHPRTTVRPRTIRATMVVRPDDARTRGVARAVDPSGSRRPGSPPRPGPHPGPQ